LHLATKDVNSKYEEASIYALSSRFEGFPMVLLEAASMSLPIVAFDCKTGPNEIIEDGKTGFLVEPENVEQFAEKLMILMKDDELRAEMGRKAFESSKRFTIDKIVSCWAELLKRLSF
ncbi:MAG: glycosyltransferase, partial [Prevotella sp.]|nr:glycosyltransferase [Prevotella sp.]